jgi:hypothetical protein
MTHIEIDRIQIALYGVSSQVAEAAAVDLDAELKRRLGVFPQHDMAAFDMGELAIGSVESEAALDAAALRGIIADRIVQVIRHRMVRGSEDLSQTSTNQGGV